MKDFAMEAILALGSGIVLAMLGIGVPDPDETKKAIEVFSKDVTDVIDKTFRAIQGDSVQVGEFTALQTNLLRTVRSDAGMTKPEQDLVALIIERSVRDAVGNHQMDLDDALQRGVPHSAAPLVTEMDSLNTALPIITERAQRIARLLEFEQNVLRKRRLQAPNATFADEKTINAENVKKDAEAQYKSAQELLARYVGGVRLVPMSPLTKDSRTGQQTVIQGSTTELLSALFDTTDPKKGGSKFAPRPPPNKRNVWFAMSVDMEDDKTPMMAMRKKADPLKPDSEWVNYDDDPMVTLIEPERAGGQVDVSHPQNVRLWMWHINEFPVAEQREFSFFLDMSDKQSPGLTKDHWSPWYAFTMTGAMPQNTFFQTFLTSLLRQKEG